MIKRISVLVVLMIFIASCGKKKFETTEDISDYLKDETNGYRYTKEVNGVSYTLQYRPTDLLVHQELGDSISESKVNELRDKYGKYLYFNLSMSANGQELLSNVAYDKNKFGKMVNDLAFYIDEKVHLFTVTKDTLEITDFIYPRMYGMSNSTTIMLVYPRDEKYLKEKYLNFTIEDLGFYTGEVRFKIHTKPLQNEPKLNFKQ